MNDIEDESKGFEVSARVRIQLNLHNQSQFLELLVAERTKEISESKQQIVRCLSRAAEFKDNETGSHVLRMSRYSRIIATTLGKNPLDAHLIELAASMHDIGKIGIPDEILLKPGKLNPREWSIMKTHCAIGAEILGAPQSELLKISRSIALTHHERWNGMGYPFGLSGVNIPLVGRITAITDVFDALTSERPYKPAWTVEEAVGYIQKEKGHQFDPDIVTAFLESFDDILEEKTRVEMDQRDTGSYLQALKQHLIAATVEEMML